MSDLVPCRYNPKHKVKRSRLVIHEYKCPNRFEGKVVVCPLDPNEKINIADYDKHVKEHTYRLGINNLDFNPSQNKKKNNENKRMNNFDDKEKEEKSSENNNNDNLNEENEENEEIEFNAENIEHSGNDFKNNDSDFIDDEFCGEISASILFKNFEDNDYNPNKEDFKLHLSKQNLIKIKKVKI